MVNIWIRIIPQESPCNNNYIWSKAPTYRGSNDATSSVIFSNPKEPAVMESSCVHSSSVHARSCKRRLPLKVILITFLCGKSRGCAATWMQVNLDEGQTNQLLLCYREMFPFVRTRLNEGFSLIGWKDKEKPFPKIADKNTRQESPSEATQWHHLYANSFLSFFQDQPGLNNQHPLTFSGKESLVVVVGAANVQHFQQHHVHSTVTVDILKSLWNMCWTVSFYTKLENT